MVFDYTAMGDARASDDLSRRVSGQVASFKERDRPDLPPGPTPVGFDKLQQMYDRTAVSFEGMQFVSRLGGAAAVLLPCGVRPASHVASPQLLAPSHRS